MTRTAIYTDIPLLDDEFISDDFHPVLFEISALRNQIAGE